MFRKKKQGLFNAVDDSRSVVYDFRLRHPFENYRTVEYRTYHKLEEDEMIPRLEDYLNKLFTGDVDEANSNMLDSIIFSVAREALPDLERQHYNHTDMLRRLILRHKTDKEDIRMLKEARESELEVIKSDYQKICNMLSRESEDI